jgi:hypothetical protein
MPWKTDKYAQTFSESYCLDHQVVNIGTCLPGYTVFSPQNCHNVYDLRFLWIWNEYSFCAILNYGKTLLRWIKNWHRFFPISLPSSSLPLHVLSTHHLPRFTGNAVRVGWSGWPTFTPTTLIHRHYCSGKSCYQKFHFKIVFIFKAFQNTVLISSKIRGVSQIKTCIKCSHIC